MVTTTTAAAKPIVYANLSSDLHELIQQTYQLRKRRIDLVTRFKEVLF